MMSVAQLVSALDAAGARLWHDDGRLSVQVATGTVSDELHQAVAHHKEQLLRMLRDAAANHTAATPRPAQRFEPFALMDVQHAYWIGRKSLVESGGVSTHLYLEFEQAGLDIARMEASLRKMIRRHDMLRAVILPDGRQKVLGEVPDYRIATTDVRGLPAGHHQQAIERTRERMSHQVLPADRWPLFEFCATVSDGDRVRLHCSLDMLILDAWSLFKLFAEWRRYYDDERYEPEPIVFNYRDYVQAEQALQDSERFKRALAYWTARLDTLPPAPDLPLAVRPGMQGPSRFTRRRGSLDALTWAALKQRARELGLTPSALLATAFCDVLRLWAKAPDFTLNLTLFNRLPLHADVKRVLGDFTRVNLLEVRAHLDDSFAARAARLQRQLGQDLEHLHYNGVRVLRELARRSGDGPRASMPIVFTSALGVEGQEASAFQAWGDVAYSISQTPQVWLDHQVYEQAGELVFNWDAVEERFPDGMLGDMFGSYVELLQRLTGDAALWDRVGNFAPLPPWQARLMEALNSTAVEAAPSLLHEGVLAQAAAQPDAVAVIDAAGSCTYGELAAQAGRLACWLRAHGATPNRLVAIAMDKGREQVAAALGILQSGAAYLPIDTQWPQERRWQVLARAEAGIVVTQTHLRGLPWPAGTQVVTLEDMAGAEAGSIGTAPAPHDLAYVVFTSGSTGEPKGVMIEHRAAANTVRDITGRFQVGPRDRVLALSSLGFDLSVYDIFGVLGAGGTVVMPAPSGLRDPAHWSALVQQHGITLWNSVPQLLQLWVEHIDVAQEAAGTTLRHVLLSGDRIPVSLPQRLRARCPQARVHSLGGATEASIWSIHHPADDVEPQSARIPYGRPLGNQTVHVLNALMEPRAVGAVGEICIGGAGVARGYWRDEERTAQHFVTHPRTGERLYRTGDLGRVLAGGVVDILGRDDSQIKLNGHRVELDEIAAHLRRHPKVRDAVVRAETHPDTRQKQLVAYVARQGGAEAPSPAAGDAAGWGSMLDAGHASLQDARGRRSGALQRFDALWERMEEGAPFVMAHTLLRMGCFSPAHPVESAAGIVERLGLSARLVPVLTQWLHAMGEAGLLVEEAPGRFCRSAAMHAAGVQARVDEYVQTLHTDEPYGPLLDYFAQHAEHLVGLLTGTKRALELLFPGGQSHVADALYHANPVNETLNEVAAAVLREFVAARGLEQPLRVLELGAGTGATTAALLPVLPAQRTRYVFTDLSTFFLDRARRRFGAYDFVDYGVLNIDQDPGSQGHAPHSCDVVVAANVLHDARAIGQTLSHLRGLLKPDGILMFVETTRGSRMQAMSVALIESFGKVMSPAQWERSALDAGFARFSTFGRADEFIALPQHLMVAQGPQQVTQPLDAAELKQALSASLPAHMVPSHYVLLDELPLSPNGKLDTKALPAPWAAQASAPEHQPPRSAVEHTLAAIWREALGAQQVGVRDSYLALGGDSLHAVQIVSRMLAQFPELTDAHDELMMKLIGDTTIEHLAHHVEECLEAAGTQLI